MILFIVIKSNTWKTAQKSSPSFRLQYSLGLQLFTFQYVYATNRRDGVVVGASALQSVDLWLNPFVESYQNILKNGVHSFPA